jgi:transcriptional regulator with XRE-family HTH domain
VKEYPEQINMEISSFLKDQLHLNKCTGSELAEALGVSKSTVSLWLNGKRIPSLRQFTLIRSFLDDKELEKITGHKSLPPLGDLLRMREKANSSIIAKYIEFFDIDPNFITDEIISVIDFRMKLHFRDIVKELTNNKLDVF